MIDLSTIEARKALAGKYATKWNIDPVLLCALVEHESSWNPWAVRFEPAFEARYIKPVNPAMPTTLELTKAMSFGLGQIMAETAIELGFQGRFMTELCDPDTGLEFAARKLHRCLTIHPPVKQNDGSLDYGLALLAYNGGADMNYPKLVMQFWNKYADPTTQSSKSVDGTPGGSN